jgi:hypothetical protein
MHEFLHDVVLHSLSETAIIIPLLFLAYVLIEYIEKHSSSKIQTAISNSGAYSPILGAGLGAIPQCGMSAVIANLFSNGVITMGAVIAVFLATSDEMIPVLLTSGIPALTVFRIIVYKVTVAAFVGITIDTFYRCITKHKPCATINDCCDGSCHCEEHGIIHGALHHTASVGVFILLCTFLLNVVLFFVGKDSLSYIISSVPILGHVIASLLGLIPNCAVSVVLSTLYAENVISLGIMLSGLFTGAGAGILVLCKTHKCKKEVLITLTLTFVAGLIFGLIADIPAITQLLTGT